jgi:hypothetical protein
METAFKVQPQLNEREWDLIIELLDREKGELPAEIHHTRTAMFRDELRRRLDLVDTLLRKLDGLRLPE